MPTGLIASAVTAALVICGEQTSPFMRRRSAGSSGGAPNGGCTTSPARALTSTRKPPRRLWRRSPPANPSAAPAYSAPPGNWTGCCASTWSRRWRPPTAAPAASPVASARRWRTSMSATAPERATPPSKAPGRRPSATRCWTHPPGCAPGSWRTLWAWTDHPGDLGQVLSVDHVLDNITLYCRGGHFAAWEQPEMFISEARAVARSCGRVTHAKGSLPAGTALSLAYRSAAGARRHRSLVMLRTLRRAGRPGCADAPLECPRCPRCTGSARHPVHGLAGSSSLRRNA